MKTSAASSTPSKSIQKDLKSKAAVAARPTSDNQPAARQGDPKAVETAAASIEPFNMKTGKTPLETLVILFVSGLMGMVGQGARTIVGLKKVSDISDTAPSQADIFSASRIFIGLMIGFVAGVAAGLTAKVFDAPIMDGGVLFYLASMGYIGADVVEGFAQTLVKDKPSPQQPSTPASGVTPVPTPPKIIQTNLKPTEFFRLKAPSVMGDLMTDFNLMEHHAAGILGNLGEELNGFTELQEIHPLVPGSRGGFGWAQWTGPRRTQFEQFCKEHKLSVVSDEANYGFLRQELQTTQKQAIAALTAQTTLEGAVQAFMNSFERPASQTAGLATRLRYAHHALDAFDEAKAKGSLVA